MKRSAAVLLHGFTGDPQSWDAVVERLPATMDVYRPPLLGHAPGNLDTASGFVAEVDRLASWLESVTSTSRRRPVLLAGYSMGGRIALGLLVRRPELFEAAVLIGVDAGIRDSELRRERARRDHDLADRLDQSGIEEFVDSWQKLPLFATQGRLSAALLERQRRRRLRHAPAGLAAALRHLGPASMPDYWPDLDHLDRPVRLMAGAQDDKFCNIAQSMADRLPRAEVEIVPDAGHNLILEAPRAVAAAIRSAARFAGQI